MYRLLADNITEHIWIMDLKLNLTYISPSVEKIYGYPLEKIKNFKLKKLFTEDSYQKMLDAFSRELPRAMAAPPSPPGTRFVLELQARHRDGHLLWIENRISLIRDETAGLCPSWVKPSTSPSAKWLRINCWMRNSVFGSRGSVLRHHYHGQPAGNRNL